MSSSHRALRGSVLILASLLGWAHASAADVIANGRQHEAALTRPLLRGMFGMRLRTWPDGTPVTVFVLDDNSPVHQEFAESVLQMYPYQLRQNWDRLLYSGTGQPPILVRTEEEMLQRVAATPGAIGYVRQWKPAPPPKKTTKGQVPPPEPVKVLHVR